MTNKIFNYFEQAYDELIHKVTCQLGLNYNKVH